MREPLAGASLFMIEIRVRNFGAMCRFYGEVLGLPSAMRDDSTSFAMFGKGPPYVAVVKKALPGRRAKSRAVPDFAVPRLDAALRRLKARGVRVLLEPSSSPEGYRIARIADPEGNEIHLFEWSAGGEPPP